MEELKAVIANGLIVLAGALVVWLTKKVVEYIDAKTSWLDDTKDAAKKADIKARIVDFAGLAVRSTAQTYVDELKVSAKAKGGKLTKEERKFAFDKARDLLLAMLKEDGLDLVGEVSSIAVDAVIESVVRRESDARVDLLAGAAGN